MAHPRKKPVINNGAGEFRCRSFQGGVDYEIQGEPSTLRMGPARMRGSFETTPEIAEQAFRDGEGVLTLESGSPYRVTLIGHSAGSGVTYFEMRV